MTPDRRQQRKGGEEGGSPVPERLRPPRAKVSGAVAIPLFILMTLGRMAKSVDEDLVVAADIMAVACVLVIAGIIRFCFLGGISFYPDRLVLHKLFRRRTIPRDRIVDFGDLPDDRTHWRRGLGGVDILLDNGAFDFSFVIGMDARSGYPDYASRVMTAWYLGIGPEDPQVDDSLNRAETVSGRPIPFEFFYHRRQLRFSGTVFFVLLLLVSPCLFVVAGFPTNWMMPGAQWLTYVVLFAAIFAWFYVDVIRARVVLERDEMKVVNRFERAVRLPRSVIAGIDIDDDITVETTDGRRLVLDVAKERWWNRGLRWRQRLERDLETWLRGPDADRSDAICVEPRRALGPDGPVV